MILATGSQLLTSADVRREFMDASTRFTTCVFADELGSLDAPEAIAAGSTRHSTTAGYTPTCTWRDA